MPSTPKLVVVEIHYEPRPSQGTMIGANDEAGAPTKYHTLPSPHPLPGPELLAEVFAKILANRARNQDDLQTINRVMKQYLSLAAIGKDLILSIDNNNNIVLTPNAGVSGDGADASEASDETPLAADENGNAEADFATTSDAVESLHARVDDHDRRLAALEAVPASAPRSRIEKSRAGKPAKGAKKGAKKTGK